MDALHIPMMQTPKKAATANAATCKYCVANVAPLAAASTASTATAVAADASSALCVGGSAMSRDSDDAAAAASIVYDHHTAIRLRQLITPCVIRVILVVSHIRTVALFFFPVPAVLLSVYALHSAVCT